MKFKLALTTIIISLVFFSNGCDEVTDSNSPDSGNNNNNENWLYPVGQIYDGGPGKDGIPALSNPTFIPANQVEYLNNDDLVLGVKFGDVIKAYPHSILDWHEIINDDIGGLKLAITYCPLTGSGIGWERIINEQETTFGVSGLLYNTNLIPYDRLTNSNWSQMGLQSINGQLIGTAPKLYQVIETTWKTWRNMYPNSGVVSTNTEFDRPYGTYPYGDYKTNHSRLLFPITRNDSRLARKIRVLGVTINDVNSAYPVTSFSDSISIIEDNLGGNQIIIVGSQKQNILLAFNKTLEGETLSFTPVQNSLPIIMMDNQGRTWDVFGNEVATNPGPNKLSSPQFYVAYWFAWSSFMDQTLLHSN